MTRNLISSGVKWIGEVPSHWRVLEPRRIFSLRREAEHLNDVHLTPSQKHGVLPQSEYMKITGNRVVLNLSGNKMQHVEAGDFISHLRTFQGGLELAHQSGKVSPAYTVVAPRDGVTVSYFKYVFKSEGYIAQIASVTDQLRDGQSMRYPEFNQTWLPLPPPVEQKQIADYLDHETAEIDAFIEDQQAMMRLLQERERSLIWDLVTGKNIDISREKTIEAFWQELPKTWTLEKVGWHFDVGNGSTPSTSTPRYWDQMGFPWVNSSSVNSDLVTEPARRVSQEALNELHLPIVPAGSLLIGITGQGKTRGTVTKLGITTTINQHVAYLTPRTSSRLNVDYARRGLEAAYPQLRHLSDGNGGTKGALTCEMVQQFRLPVPPAEVQIRIVQDLDIHSSETESALLDAQLFIDLALERRAALITAAVTGQIDVTAKNKPAAEQLEDDIAQGLHKES